ncbi:hypothetical protein D3C73_990750 [compost metagenome]
MFPDIDSVVQCIFVDKGLSTVNTVGTIGCLIWICKPIRQGSRDCIRFKPIAPTIRLIQIDSCFKSQMIQNMILSVDSSEQTRDFIFAQIIFQFSNRIVS